MVGIGDGWLVMVGGVGGVCLVEVTGMSHYFFFLIIISFMLNYFQNILSTFFFIFLDEDMIIIMTLLGKIFGKRK